MISHDHYDHLDTNTISRLVERYPAVVWHVPLGLAEFLKRSGARDVIELDWWGENSVAALKLTCVPAQHFSGRTLGRRNQTLWCGWTLRAPERSVFFAGDTALHPEFATIGQRCGPFELAILPIGAYEPRWFMGAVHMNPDDCIKAITQLAGAQKGERLLMAAAHWGTFKLTDEPMDEPPALMRELWQAAGFDPTNLWIMRHGETRTVA